MEVDFIIVGQGLAGSALAMALLKSKKSILVVDDASPSAATRVAAGLVTTLAGKGMNPAWRQAEYLPKAMLYYSELEKESGRKLFYPLPVLRLFADEKEVCKFSRKQEEVQQWVGEINPSIDGQLHGSLGGFEMAHGGWLDTVSYLEVVKQKLIEAKSYRVAEWRQEDVKLDSGEVQWNEIRASRLIVCQGFRGLQSGWFSYLPHRSAKGEMLTVRMESLPQDRIINRNGWMVPVGEQLWRAGASYEWDDLTTNHTEQGAQEIKNKIEALTSSDYEVVSHEVGVRPIVQRSQPVAGMHPEYQQVGIFNGLGSKGVITAPCVGEHFAAHLCGEIDLDPELDVRRMK